jgi:hypothetical protein
MTAKKKAKKQARKKAGPRKPRDDAAGAVLPFGVEPFIPAVISDASLHDLFQQQTIEMLDRSDLTEEQRQSILLAMNCPCCGGSGLSFTMKLKRKK